MNAIRYLLLLGALFSACNCGAQDIVRLGNLKFAHYGAVAYMKVLAPKYHLKIEERMFAKGLDIILAIVAGEIDVAASAADAAIAARASGAPVYVVAGFAKGGARLVARPDTGIKSVADLKGKKVGVARGGAQELLLLAELAKAGLSWSDRPGKDVEIFYMAFADLNQALLQKQLDAICQSEPQSSQAIHKGFGVEVLKPREDLEVRVDPIARTQVDQRESTDRADEVRLVPAQELRGVVNQARPDAHAVEQLAVRAELDSIVRQARDPVPGVHLDEPRGGIGRRIVGAHLVEWRTESRIEKSVVRIPVQAIVERVAVDGEFEALASRVADICVEALVRLRAHRSPETAGRHGSSC